MVMMGCSDSKTEVKAIDEKTEGKVIGFIGAMCEEVEILHYKMEIKVMGTNVGM